MSHEEAPRDGASFPLDENEFLHSLKTLTPDDISDVKKKKRRVSDLIFDNLRIVLLLVCSLVLVISVIYIGDSLRHYIMADSLYGDLQNMMQDGATVDMMFASPSSPTTPDYQASQNLSGDDIAGIITPSRPVNKEYEMMKVKLAGLKAQYPDLYGWIRLPGTVIDYPIMQSTDNDYYLDHSYSGSSLKAGAIFADYRCNRTLLSNQNLVIYGHHMTNNSMFNPLDNYFKEAFFRSNNTIYIYTLDGMYTYEVFSVYETTKYYPYIRTYFANSTQFVSFATELMGNSIHPYRDDFAFRAEDRILTLSTCNNRTDDGRIAVHAVLTDIYSAQ